MTLPRKMIPRRRMQQKRPLNQIQRLNNQNIILSIIALPQQPIQTIDQATRHIPLKAILQLKELPERQITAQFRQRLEGRRFFAWVDD